MKPTKQQETGMAVAVVVVILSLLFLCSCSAKKTVTEYIYVHDTLTSLKVDTIKDVRVSVQHDTIREHESHTYTINNVGDTVKEIHHYHESEKVIVIDSTERYQARIDSLQRIVDSQKEKEVVKTKIQVPWKWVAYILCGLLAVFVLVTRDRK